MPRTKLAAFDLKGARESRGLSQAATAEILCTTQASVSRWESEGDMPAIYRKAWTQHWLLERSNGNNRSVRQAARGAAKFKQGSNKARASTRRIKSGAVRSRTRETAGDTALPVSDSTAPVRE